MAFDASDVVVTSARHGEVRLPKWLSRFTRTASSGKVIREVDGLRFVAIVWVIFFHLTGSLLAFRARDFSNGLSHVVGLIASNGHYGVELFFAISGFVLGLPFVRAVASGKKRPSLRAYFARRLTRLEPPYLINLIVLFTLLRTVRVNDSHISFGHLFASATYMHGLIYGVPSTVNAVAWSLEIEIQFYILLPLLAQVYRLRSATDRMGVFAIAILAFSVGRVFIELGTGIAPRAIMAYLQYFLVGMALADIYVRRWAESPSQNHLYDIVSLIGWPLLLTMSMTTNATLTILPWLLAILFVSALRGSWSRKTFRATPVTLIGGMCYTLYLYHYLVLVTAGKVLLWRFAPTENFTTYVLVQFVLAFVTTTFVGAILFLAFERPFMNSRWSHRLVPASGSARARSAFSVKS